MQRATFIGWAVGVLTMLLLCSASRAQVHRSIRFESVPKGAEMFLLIGDERQPIGTTPLRYDAQFHSEVSVLRFGFTRPGYRETTVEVAATLDHVVTQLEAAPLAANEALQTDPSLLPLEKRWGPTIEKALLAMREQGAAARVDGVGALQRLGKAVYLVVPLQLLGASAGPVGPVEAGAVARRLEGTVWSPLAQKAPASAAG